jgi:sugar phosphate isomerase/epimerase
MPESYRLRPAAATRSRQTYAIGGWLKSRCFLAANASEGDAVKVACSTLCFSRLPLDRALKTMEELEFTKVDAAISAHGPHITPADVAADPVRCARLLRYSSSVVPAALNLEFEENIEREKLLEQFEAICKMARSLSIATLTIPAAPTGSDLESEAGRLRELVAISETYGLVLTVETRIGTLSEIPHTAVKLCERVPGLTLDPSHYICGPNQNKPFDQVYPYVKHVHLRDTGRTMDKMQVRVGQGEIEYSRIITQLEKHRYDRVLTVEIEDRPDNSFPMETEVRKLKFLLESLAA